MDGVSESRLIVSQKDITSYVSNRHLAPPDAQSTPLLAYIEDLSSIEILSVDETSLTPM